jgi:hypothetical protein
MKTSTVSPKQKEIPTKPPQDDRFFQLFLVAFGNLHAQPHIISAYDEDGREYVNLSYAEDEWDRSARCLARMAWESATAAQALFAKEETIKEFNKELDAAAKRELESK